MAGTIGFSPKPTGADARVCRLLSFVCGMPASGPAVCLLVAVENTIHRCF